MGVYVLENRDAKGLGDAINFVYLSYRMFADGRQPNPPTYAIEGQPRRIISRLRKWNGRLQAQIADGGGWVNVHVGGKIEWQWKDSFGESAKEFEERFKAKPGGDLGGAAGAHRKLREARKLIRIAALALSVVEGAEEEWRRTLTVFNQVLNAEARVRKMLPDQDRDDQVPDVGEQS